MYPICRNLNHTFSSIPPKTPIAQRFVQLRASIQKKYFPPEKINTIIKVNFWTDHLNVNISQMNARLNLTAKPLIKGQFGAFRLEEFSFVHRSNSCANISLFNAISPSSSPILETEKPFQLEFVTDAHPLVCDNISLTTLQNPSGIKNFEMEAKQRIQWSVDKNFAKFSLIQMGWFDGINALKELSWHLNNANPYFTPHPYFILGDFDQKIEGFGIHFLNSCANLAEMQVVFSQVDGLLHQYVKQISTAHKSDRFTVVDNILAQSSDSEIAKKSESLLNSQLNERHFKNFNKQLTQLSGLKPIEAFEKIKTLDHSTLVN